MATTLKYCKKCNSTEKCNTQTYAGGSPMGVGERILFGLFTFGFNEMMIKTCYQCTHCGYKFY